MPKRRTIKKKPQETRAASATIAALPLPAEIDVIDQFFRSELDQIFSRQQLGTPPDQISWTGMERSEKMKDNDE